jgi:ferredoxin-NADP reductase
MTHPLVGAAEPELVDEALVCTGIEDVTHDVKSIDLARLDGSALPFLPGQYLTVAVETDDGEVQQRCYSISSSANRPDLLTITVKRTPDGPVSGLLHERLAVGDVLQATGPHGRFTTTRHPAAGYLFLSAGSGITPVMSMTRALHEGPAPADVVFVHSARSPRDVIFGDELASIAERPGFSVTVVCETADPEDKWEGPTGLLTLRTLLRVAPDLHEREVFTCGPPAYMRAVREMLELAGVDPARCHEESFDLATRASAAHHEVPTGPAPVHAVELRRSGHTLACRSDETILDAASRAGVPHPSMCREGICGTCRTTLLAGQVDLQHAGGLRPRDVERGEILLCCSRPLGDVVVDA